MWEPDPLSASVMFAQVSGGSVAKGTHWCVLNLVETVCYMSPVVPRLIPHRSGSDWWHCDLVSGDLSGSMCQPTEVIIWQGCRLMLCRLGQGPFRNTLGKMSKIDAV